MRKGLNLMGTKGRGEKGSSSYVGLKEGVRKGLTVTGVKEGDRKGRVVMGD